MFTVAKVSSQSYGKAWSNSNLKLPSLTFYPDIARFSPLLFNCKLFSWNPRTSAFFTLKQGMWEKMNQRMFNFSTILSSLRATQLKILFALAYWCTCCSGWTGLLLKLVRCGV